MKKRSSLTFTKVTTHLSIVLTCASLSLVGCQNQSAEEDKFSADETFSDNLPSSDNPEESGDGTGSQSPSASGGEEWVKCNSVAAFNTEIEKISQLAQKCSFSSVEVDTKNWYVFSKQLKTPVSNASSSIETIIPRLNESEGMKISYSKSDLRSGINPFFGVKVGGQCEEKFFSLKMHEGYSNATQPGDGLGWYPAKNHTQHIEFANEKKPCMSLQIDKTGAHKKILIAGKDVYYQLPLTEENGNTVHRFVINGKTWKINAKENFSSCSANPSLLSIYSRFQATVGSGGGLPQLNYFTVTAINHERLKPAAKYIDGEDRKERDAHLVNGKYEYHMYSCYGYINNFKP
jgi:hypothetical protein